MVIKVIDRLCNDNMDFLYHVAGHGIRLLFTMVILKIISVSSNVLYTEEPIIITYMESISSSGLLAIFLIQVLFDIYDTVRIHRQNKEE